MNARHPIQADLYSDLEYRGIVKQVTDPGLEGALGQTRLTLYCGFDPTSDSLHVGSLLPLLTLRRFQRAGHRVIAVVGGATGMIGDPSGKSAERSLLTYEQVERNKEGIAKVIARFLELEGPDAAMIANNAEWFRGLSYIDFLRDIGKHFTINHMMAKESVRARLEDREHGISYTEFSYMLLQSYDFYHLYKEQGCRLQIGGSDQWGNITAGIELIRRMGATEDNDELGVFGLTHPLVTKADGTKFGKTEQGTIWLDPTKTSPYQFYQFLIQTADADVMTYLKFFTFLSRAELESLEESVRKEPEKREAQRALARELTKLVHGEAELARSEKATQALFGTEIRELDGPTLLQVFSGAPSSEQSRAKIEAGYPLIDALVDTGLCASKGAARKDLAGGGIYVNNARASDPMAQLKSGDLIAGSYVVLRKGKKNYSLLSFR
jgi:tyrosyl-tRNA synthetase